MTDLLQEALVGAGALSETWIGPIGKAVYNLRPSWEATPEAASMGMRGASIQGKFTLSQANQLNQLISNPDAHTTNGEVWGVLVPVWFGAISVSQFSGWYLLQTFTLGLVSVGANVKTVEGEIGAMYVPDSELVLVRSSVPKSPNELGPDPKSMVVSPFRPESSSGDRFVVDPGGTFGTRLYDPEEYDPASPTSSFPTAIGFYVGDLTVDSDELEEICYPKFAWGRDTPPWLTHQGGRVRARDRRTRELVFGRYPFFEATDLWVGNGLINFWVGNRGLIPFLNLEVFDGAAWKAFGTIQFHSSAVLQRARLTSINSEEAQVSLTVDTYGDLTVTLRRGERGIRVDSPNSNLRPRFFGTPPASIVSAVNDDGHFGNGLGAGHSGATWDDPETTWDDLESAWDGTFAQPNLRMFWPPFQAQQEGWFAFWLRPYSSAGVDAGYMLIYDDQGDVALQLYQDAADDKIKLVTMATLASAAQTFDSGEDLFILVRFSNERGLGFSIRSPSGTVVHYIDPLMTKGTAGLYGVFGFFGVQHAIDDVYPADDIYPVDDIYPGSLVWGDGELPGYVRQADGVISNLMIGEGWPSTARIEALAGSATPLGGLDDDEGDLIWYSPFNVIPLPNFSLESSGRSVAGAVQSGFTMVTAFLDAAHTSSAAYLATGEALDGVEEVHAQMGGENYQEEKLRA